jgi:Xaa-Pro aminopeptidase
MSSLSLHSRVPVRAYDLAPEVPASVFAERRERFLERIGDGVAIVPAGAELRKSRDTEIVYRQSSDLYYLTGYPEPQAVAVLRRDSDQPFILFVRRRSPEQEAWTGPRIGVERAGEEYRADAVFGIDELPTRLPELLRSANSVHYPIGASEQLDRHVADAVRANRGPRQRAGSGPSRLVDLEATTGEMRLIKDAHELERMRVAAHIAAAGHVAAMERARPGAGEWEIQAELEATFRSLGADGPAYPTIVGAGANGTILHYVANRHRVREHDLVLIDAGAEWGMYSADITRTFPASGRFTPQQRDLYDLVLLAEEAGIEAVRPGAPVSAVHDAAVRVLAAGMMDLGLIPRADLDESIAAGAHRRFYLHSTSHWLGLDVHDVGPYRRGEDAVVLAAGMVLTVEPGLYIAADAEDVDSAFRGLGIRIEDNVIVTEIGKEVITREVPVDPQEIERIVMDS